MLKEIKIFSWLKYIKNTYIQMLSMNFIECFNQCYTTNIQKNLSSSTTVPFLQNFPSANDDPRNSTLKNFRGML